MCLDVHTDHFQSNSILKGDFAVPIYSYMVIRFKYTRIITNSFQLWPMRRSRAASLLLTLLSIFVHFFSTVVARKAYKG